MLRRLEEDVSGMPTLAFVVVETHQGGAAVGDAQHLADIFGDRQASPSMSAVRTGWD